MEGRVFCKALKDERTSREFTLEEIAMRSNIPIKVLQALEAGSIEDIPGRFYIRGFLRSYLAAVGADEKDFFLKHRNEIDTVTREDDVEKLVCFSKLRYKRFRSNRLIYMLAGFLLLVLLFFSLPQLEMVRSHLGVPGLTKLLGR